MITKEEFIALAEKTAADYRTVYAKGAFGSPVTAAFLKTKAAQYPDFYTPEKCAALLAKAEEQKEPLFGFDCICFVKGLLWGWRGDGTAAHGGAVYASGGVPDVTVEQMKALCLGVSSDFRELTPGELLFMPGHVGIYLGEGLCVEATSKWQGGVLLSGVANTGFSGNYAARRWQSHGRLPFFEGDGTAPESGAASGTAGQPGGQEKVQIALPMLQKGCKSESVRAMQALLTLRGYTPGKCGSDASFGGDTCSAVLSFQRDMGISPDGICGKATWSALLAA